MNRPTLEKAAAEVAGKDANATELVDVLLMVLPLLQLCAGAGVAGWMAGDRPRVLGISRSRAVEIREGLIVYHLRHHNVPEPAIRRAIAKLKITPDADVVAAYREAGLR